MTKKRFTKALSVTTSVTTTLWMAGAAFVAPLSTKAAVTINDGEIFRASNDYKVYIAKHVGAAKYKRWFVGPQMFDYYKHLSFAVVKVVDPSVAASYTESKLVRMDGDQKVYFVGNAVAGQGADKQWVTTLEAFNAAGFNWDMVYVINSAEANWYTMGANYGGAVTPSTTPTGGTVGVSLATDNPAGAIIPESSVYNGMLKLSLVGGPAQVTGITLTKYGLLTNTDVSGVSVWDSTGKRHGSVVSSISSDNKVTVGFGSDPINVTGSETLFVKINIGDVTANTGTVYFGVASAADIATNGTIGGAFPLMGNLFSITSGSLGNVYVDAISAGGAANSTTANTDVGDVQKEVGRFQFTQNNGTEDIQIESLTFYVEGNTTESKDVLNWKLYDVANNVLATAEKPVDRYVTMKLANPYKIEKGLNRTLVVKADFKDGANRWIRLHVQNDYDVMIKGVSTGAYVLPLGPAGAAFSDQADANSYFLMRQGGLTVTMASGSPSGQLAAGATDALLAKFTLRPSGEDMEVRKMDLRILTGGTTDTALTGNVSVRSSDGAITYVTMAAATGSTIYLDTTTRFDLSTYIQLKSNTETVINVYGNISSSAVATDRYQAEVKNFYVKRLSSIDFTDLATTGVTANNLSVVVGDATVAMNSAFGNSTVPPSLSNAKIGSFVVQGGVGEDMRISTILVSFAADPSPDLTNIRLMMNGVQQGTAIGTPVQDNNSFSVSINVPKSTPVVIDIYADVKSDAAGTQQAIIGTEDVTLIGLSTSNSVTKPASDQSLQTTTFGAGSLTVTKDSSSPTEQIMTPANGVLLGNWKFEALNENLTLAKVTFTARTGAGAQLGTSTGDSNFGTMYLKDGSTTIASGALVSDGTSYNVVFSGFNVTIPASGSKVLSLYSDLTTSGTQDPNTIVIWTLKSDTTPTDIDVTGSAGQLSTDNIDTTGSTSGADTFFATGTRFLYHNSKPVIAAASNTPSGSKSPESNQEVFIFTVTNSGTRDMRISSLSVSISTSGGSVTNAISDIDLYDGTTKIGDNGVLVGGETSMGGNSGSKEFVFNTSNDTSNNYFTNFVISAGASKTFTVKADTTSVRGALTSGQYVTVSTRVNGTTGSSSGTAWNEGDVEYYYTPVFGSELGPYSASDSYPVTGGTLTY